MKHFKTFPKIQYDGETVTDVFSRLAVQEVVQDRVSNYNYVDVADGLRPDGLSRDFYGTTEVAWLFFYANQVQDPLFDWVLGPQDFADYLRNKYRTADPERIFEPRGEIRSVYIDPLTDQRIVQYTIQRNTPIRIGDSIKHPYRDEYRKVIEIINQNSFVVASFFSSPFPTSPSLLEGAYIFTDVHSYYDLSTGLRIDYDTFVQLADNIRRKITIYEWEFANNERKRKMKVINPVEGRQIANELITIFKK
jgi:hypothetical protein